MTRRDRCFLVGKRALTLSEQEAACAWWCLASSLEDLGIYQLDRIALPKFNDLLTFIRQATIKAKS